MADCIRDAYIRYIFVLRSSTAFVKGLWMDNTTTRSVLLSGERYEVQWRYCEEIGRIIARYGIAQTGALETDIFVIPQRHVPKLSH